MYRQVRIGLDVIGNAVGTKPKNSRLMRREDDWEPLPSRRAYREDELLKSCQGNSADFAHARKCTNLTVDHGSE